jgi:bifunctional ADP-heptose synthase (sugar kinase/adenylyltransferase)
VDSRTKIVPLDEAQRIAARGARIVAGTFDPLLASHAEQLRDLKREGVPLVVAIAEPEDPILPARARAELVAGLTVVDFVVESAEGIAADVRLEEDHARKREELIDHVHSRQERAS